MEYVATWERDSRNKGLEEGIEKGEKIGQENKAKDMAKKMKKNKEPIDKISKYTGLSKEEIEKL